MERLSIRGKDYTIYKPSSEQRERDIEMGRKLVEFANAFHYPVILTAIEDTTKGVVSSIASLQEKILNLQTDAPLFWNISPDTTRAALDKFRANGIVEAIKINQTRTKEYFIPEERKSDVNLAVLIMDLCFQHDKNPLRLFGSKQSKSKDASGEANRSGSTRVSIFRELVLRDTPISAAELAEKLSIPFETVQKTLLELSRKKVGILNYQSFDPGAPLVTYSISTEKEGQPTAYLGHKTATEKIYAIAQNLIKSGKTPTIREIHTEYVKQGGTDNETTTTSILAHIADEGFLDQYKEPSSQVWLSEDQRIFLAHLLWIIDLHDSDLELINQAQQIKQRILTDTSYTGELMFKATKLQPSLDDIILELLEDAQRENGKGFTTKELYDLIVESGLDVTLSSVGHSATLLLNAGQVVATKTNTTNDRNIEIRYTLNPSKENTEN